MKKGERTTIAQFDQDVVSHGGYLYTEKPSKSSLLANERLTKATLALLDLKDKTVIDIGCGDGIYTKKLYWQGKPKLMVGIDAARQAIVKAKKNYGTSKKNLIFETGNCYEISYPDKKFDIAIARGLVHHLQKPQKAIKEILRVADQILIIEPNGYNPLLKIIEKFSLYHRRHQEKSYLPYKIRQWVTSFGAKTESEDYLGLVPFFCPDFLTDFLKKVEPFFEKSFLKTVTCAVYVVKARQKKLHD